MAKENATKSVIKSQGWNRQVDTPAPYPAWDLEGLPQYLGKGEFILLPLGSMQWPGWGYSELHCRNGRNSKQM